MLRKINGLEFEHMLPYYRNFNGDIVRTSKGFETLGKFKLDENESLLSITELPIGTWTRKYKNFLEDLITKETVKDFSEYHTSSSIDF